MENYPVIDFHSHILPRMDDGSDSVETSLEMLRVSRSRGVDMMVATSHYYRRKESIASFLERREDRLSGLSSQMDNTCCGIIPGAEVAFYFGMDEDAELERLCIGDSRALLLEMPFQSWGAYEINVLSSLCFNRRFTVVLAHYERFAEYEKGNKLYAEVLELPVVVQINAASLCTGFRARRWIRMFRDGQAHILGSDCHNLGTRSPDLDRGREVIRKKLGQEALAAIDRNASALLLGRKPKRTGT